MEQALVEIAGLDPAVLADEAAVFALAQEKGIKLEPQAGVGKAKTELFELLVEELLMTRPSSPPIRPRCRRWPAATRLTRP